MEKAKLIALECFINKGPVQLKKGQVFKAIVAPFSHKSYPITFIGNIEEISVGSLLGEELDYPLFKIENIFWLVNSFSIKIGVELRSLVDISLNKKRKYLLWKDSYTLARITLSDKGFLGDREDLSGPIIEKLVQEHLPLSVCLNTIIPDDYYLLVNILTEMAYLKKIDLIVTTGGTGVTARDITPEATEKVIERRLWGYEHAIFSEGLKKTKHAIISRAICGITKQSLIINLPGSKRAVMENLSSVLPAIKHTLEKIKNDPSECGD